jgi:hypothetical protein
MKVFLHILLAAVLLSSCQRFEAKVTGMTTSAEVASGKTDAGLSQSAPVTSDISIPITKLPQAEYLEWIRNHENGLFREEEIDDLTFSVFYKPVEYVVLHELMSSEISIDSFQNYYARYEGLQYFTLSIRSRHDEDILRHNLSNERQYYERIDYCSFRMQTDLQLVDGKDTLACRIFHYERTYQVAPYTNFVLAFEDKSSPSGSSEKDKTLIFHDQAFGKGIVKLKLKAKDLNKVPKLLIK